MATLLEHPRLCDFSIILWLIYVLAVVTITVKTVDRFLSSVSSNALGVPHEILWMEAFRASRWINWFTYSLTTHALQQSGAPNIILKVLLRHSPWIPELLRPFPYDYCLIFNFGTIFIVRYKVVHYTKLKNKCLRTLQFLKYSSDFINFYASKKHLFATIERQVFFGFIKSDLQLFSPGTRSMDVFVAHPVNRSAFCTDPEAAWRLSVDLLQKSHAGSVMCETQFTTPPVRCGVYFMQPDYTRRQ